jgi:hypothetical protein
MTIQRPKKNSYRFKKEDNAKRFVDVLRTKFNMSADEIACYHKMEVSLDLPEDKNKRAEITKEANKLEGYLPTQPDFPRYK